ncbi:MAG: tetratricopeptide repeat protein [Pyrinomonadaceae bacterium]|nr:tetratricopeptide repeat protein [Pyrinomonadaceae bacterium]
MKFEKIALIFTLSLTGITTVSAQNAPSPQFPLPSPTPKLSSVLAQNLESSRQTEISRERREQALAKLLEGQRYIWSSSRMRSQMGGSSTARLARQALQKAVELDPTLAEGYTALAELSISAPPNDIEEAILLANISIKLNPRNFGAHRILARLYTFKSRLNDGVLDKTFAEKAINSWKEIAKLDPRNAEAWAFLSEYYSQTNKPEEQIDALRRWVSSATPIETQFYRRVMGGDGNLTPDSATLKLGNALLKSGKNKEALELFSQVVADDPENNEAIENLREAVNSVDSNSAALAVESLRQAVFANPTNLTLITFLAEVQTRAGKIDDAAKVLRDSSTRLAPSDKFAAASLQIALGDIFVKAKRVDDAVNAYQTALKVRGIEEMEPVADSDRDFTIGVFEKIIQTYKNANRPTDAKAAIEKARQLLGKDDLFADRQMISFYRESGKKSEALETVRSVRKRYPDDYFFLRLEAQLLTENGKVDEGVSLIKNLIEKKKIKTAANDNQNTEIDSAPILVTSPMYDDFNNYIYISTLYSEANRGKEAIDSANQAYNSAQGTERKLMARLVLASAYQMSGDFKSAEDTLRQILKESPDNPNALNNLGYFLVERNVKLEEAVTLIKRALKIDPTNPNYLDSLGWAYFKLENFPEAEKFLLEAAMYDSGSATIQEHIGDVYQKIGKQEQAKTAWQKAFNLASEKSTLERLKEKLKQKK